jgi:prepilin-type N-terminal cleavage/methylation domain-containing protein
LRAKLLSKTACEELDGKRMWFPSRTAGFTLLEIMIVITIIGILAALVIPNSNRSIYDQVVGAAGVVAGDVAYARSLAVANNDRYRLTFNTSNNCYTLTHSGTNNSTLDVLPKTAFTRSNEPNTQQTTSFADLPHLGPGIQLVKVQAVGTPATTITYVEFDTFGQLYYPSDHDVALWLSAGKGTAARYLAVRIDKLTGLATVSPYDFTATSP